MGIKAASDSAETVAGMVCQTLACALEINVLQYCDLQVTY